MSATEWPSRVVPAQLSFLAIYNPVLGPTDETFRDQLVFYYSRVANEARSAAKKHARSDAAGGDALRKEENEKLRQIGLAQGMVDFAKSFSNGEAVDSIETDKSRIVLHELEKDWWIVASIDLTQLPAIATAEPAKKSNEVSEPGSTVEYSSREVSTPALLVQQLLQAHSIFCLHHGPSLDDLFVRLSREKFCSTLDRFWTRFARGWDVLLHGNPAVDLLNGLKLASGGELGYGVGEEEWGSGEREVLEDVIRRTEGLEDVLVSRFGDPASAEAVEETLGEEAVPWLGSARQPLATDGIIFSGVGSLERHCIRDVSLWMRQIYTYGEYAYGVRDNPLRERRKRRRKNPEENRPSNGNPVPMKPRSPERGDLRRNSGIQDDSGAAIRTGHGLTLPEDRRPEIHPRVASHDYTTTPEGTQTPPTDDGRATIPPPIVTATERALEKATREIDKTESDNESKSQLADDESGTTLGIPDHYMKYLTLGLSTFGKSNSRRRPAARRESSASIGQSGRGKQLQKDKVKKSVPLDPDDDGMMNVDPMPDGETLKSRIANQIRQENKGHFLVGLRGDLDAVTEDDEVSLTDGSLQRESEGARIVLRTIQVKTVQTEEDKMIARRPSRPDLDAVKVPLKDYRRMRVLVYVHRPFIYCFLFENRTSSLQLVEYYRSLHQILSPIKSSLLSSTDVAKVTQRIEESHTTNTTTAEGDKASDALRNILPSKGTSTMPIYDLLYDPRLLTVHTSIPNIPIPGSPAAEGIASLNVNEAHTPAHWTRLEALNVHSQILNTLQSVKNRKQDIERTSKTTRGWWVVWMKLPPSQTSAVPHRETDADSEASEATMKSDQHVQISSEGIAFTTRSEQQPDLHRIAFLVRKASDVATTSTSTSASSRAMTSLFSNMSSLGLGSRSEDSTGGASAGWGPAALAGGIGVDARRYVEGLLSLNR